MGFRQKGTAWTKKYQNKPKETSVYTPENLSYFIFQILSPVYPNKKRNFFILDPCVGKGSLLKPWKEAGYRTWGIDIRKEVNPNAVLDFLNIPSWGQLPKPDLIICNPPFNGSYPKLAPEMWMDKLVALFGKEQPIVFFTTYQLRVCHSLTSKRYQKWLKKWPEPCSILCLPDNIFAPYTINSEVIFFNIPSLKPHYFLGEVKNSLSPFE